MNFKIAHNNYNVLDLKRSMEFYSKALGMSEQHRLEAEDGSFVLVYMGYPGQTHQVELTWLRDRKAPYNLGENEIHLALTVDDMNSAQSLHKEMDCICFENKEMGIYFIADPDGYWIEIMPH